MTEQEMFEQWLKDENMWFKDFSEYTNLGYPNAIKAAGFESWKAAKQDSAAELQVKRDIIIEMECRMKEMRVDKTAEITQLQAENLKLREALEKLARLGSHVSPHYGNSQGNMLARQALASTPSHSLQEHDNELIERCALVCDWDAKQSKQIGEPFAAAVAEILAEEIRELKGKP